MTSPIAALPADAIVVDMHNDMPTKVLDEAYDPDVRHPAGSGAGAGHTDLPRLLESGVGAQFFAAFVEARFARTPGASFARAVAAMDVVEAFVARHPAHLQRADSAADVRRAREQGRIAVLLGVEGGHAIEGSLDQLRALHARGARYLTLTWNNGNDWAGSSIGCDGTRTGGLTAFGREVIREMNRLGMVVDLSHVSVETFHDALDESRAPVIASHSNARALADHPRNLDDEQLRAIARTGGVVNVNFFSRFLSAAHDRARAEIDGEMAEERRRRLTIPGARPEEVERWCAAETRRRIAALPPVPFDAVLDHLEHVARVAGAEHVGIGSDFDGIDETPEGLEDVTRIPRIATALAARGWSPGDLAKLLGGNMLRVLEGVARQGAR